MIHKLSLLLVLFVALSGRAEGQKRCVKGIPCGNTCIAATKTCRIDGGAAPSRAVPTRGPAAPAPESAARGAAQGAPLPPLEAEGTCVLASVTDGDTVICEGGARVRLLLIDAPEMSQGEYGRLARQFLVASIPSKSVLRMEFDVQRQDRYGRTLAYLYTQDGRMVNEEMARAGYALTSVYPPNVKHVERIRAAVAGAREARAGLWEGSAFECAPADHRANRCE